MMYVCLVRMCSASYTQYHTISSSMCQWKSMLASLLVQSVHSNVRAAESVYGLAMHVAKHLSIIKLAIHAICHDTITCQATHVPRVLHISAFHNTLLLYS